MNRITIVVLVIGVLVSSCSGRSILADLLAMEQGDRDPAEPYILPPWFNGLPPVVPAPPPYVPPIQYPFMYNPRTEGRRRWRMFGGKK